MMVIAFCMRSLLFESAGGFVYERKIVFAVQQSGRLHDTLRTFSFDEHLPALRAPKIQMLVCSVSSSVGDRQHECAVRPCSIEKVSNGNERPFQVLQHLGAQNNIERSG